MYIFKKTCPPQKDLVIMKAMVDNVQFEKIIQSDEKFSAMQKATAFPIASVAHTVTSSDLHATVLKYDDIPYPQFNKWLNQLFHATL